MNALIKNSNMGALSAIFGATALSSNTDELGAGISSGFGTISYKGKVWSDKYGGIVTPHMREDGDGTRSYIDVVMVKAASVLSKKYTLAAMSMAPTPSRIASRIMAFRPMRLCQTKSIRHAATAR